MLTCIEFYSSMSEHVLFEMLSLSERLVTLFTSKRFFSGLEQHVLFEVSSLCKGIGTLYASKWIVS